MKLTHCAIRITNPGRSLEFYQLLGFARQREARLEKFQTTLYFLAGPEGLQLELVHNRTKAASPEMGDGFLHLGLEVENLDLFLEGLFTSGIEPAQKVFTTPEGMKICFLVDPDGYQVELMEHPQK